MTKLNYSNRRSEGVKLGPIIAKDLRKKVKSACTRNDSHKEIHGLELNVQGKKLTDEGLNLAAEGLEDALFMTGTRLQTLNLADNELTVISLARLAPSLLKASDDIEDLDLSHNSIAVMTDDDAEYWETFLDSLRRCHKLQKLNLSHNNLYGSRPFEIFTRTYMRHFEANEDEWDSEVAPRGSFIPDYEQAEQNLDEAVDALNLKTVGDSHLSTLNPGERITKSRRASGLPLIRTISFANVSMDDRGALFLSYVIPRHRWAKRELTIGAQPLDEWPSTPKSIDSEIIWVDNQQLGTTGLKILQLADRIIYDPFDQRPVWQENISPSDIERLRKQSAASINQNKTSNDTSLSDQTKKPGLLRGTALEELETLRRKVQRGIIETDGIFNVQLWRVALKLLSLSRQLITADSRKQTEQNCGLEAENGRRNAGIEQTLSRQYTWPHPMYHSPAEWPELGAVPKCASSKTSTRNVSPHPPSTHRSESSGDSPALAAHTHSSGTMKLHSVNTKPVSAEILPCGLTKDIWRDIFENVARSVPQRQSSIIIANNDAHTARFSYVPPHPILNINQQNAVINWGIDSKTLVTEGELLGKPRSVQIWRLLDRLGCLTYEVA